MKIICSGCKKVMGEAGQKIKAKCTDCIAKEKEAIAKFELTSPGDGKEIVLENGLKGTLWAAKTEDEKLSFWELGIAGKKFVCGEKDRDILQKQLEEMGSEQCDVSFLHSITCTLPPSSRGRKKKDVDVQVKAEKHEDIYYNCTVQVDKHVAESMYKAKLCQLMGIVDILAQAAKSTYVAQNKQRDDMKQGPYDKIRD